MRRVILQPEDVFSNDNLQRMGAFNPQALEAATAIIENVMTNGDEALRSYTQQFDGVVVDNFRVPPEVVSETAAACEPVLADALAQAAEQIRDFHERQKQQSWFTIREDGALVGAKVTPLDSVGIYVPGGRALYPSTLLMNAIPASVAGVKRIAITTPPTKDGLLDTAICKAAELAGVTEIYRVGGAQAIAALAYGTQQIPAVDMITGPGNAYVAAAKKLVSGDVGVDMIAGPSEVCVVADETADPSLVAIDLMAQAEHDPLATCYLVVFSEEYANQVEAAIAHTLVQSTRAEITSASLENRGLCVVADNLAQALDVVNVIAPEHLELHIADPMSAVGSIRHAGAIFLGEWTPEAVGDYVAGPNHTLPTGGTARFSSPLSVEHFVKKSSIIQYSEAALKRDADIIMGIARHEGLWAHAMSVELRQKRLESHNDAVDADAFEGARMGAEAAAAAEALADEKA